MPGVRWMLVASFALELKRGKSVLFCPIYRDVHFIFVSGAVIEDAFKSIWPAELSSGFRRFLSDRHARERLRLKALKSVWKIIKRNSGALNHFD